MLEPFAQKHGILYLAVTKSKHFLFISWDKTARIVSYRGWPREVRISPPFALLIYQINNINNFDKHQ
ncbi:TPA: hypothetical protein I7704_09325 [Vibrio vulnificus]|nr:hypothetical protein [Vibrio vulnificus]EGR0082359.1 hypothetical protein [Vibrio vulnificus]NVC71506.1 hypothetical protein [Vibrio vulnificus]RZP63749.1 hypothetical protein D8T47_00320 [Vibrio vulnificus]HAS8194044.1 hypothetical protein [Vibrio vulnificus]